MVYVSRRLRPTADGTEAPLSAAEGILAGLNNHASMLASVVTREGIDELLTKIAPLTAAIEMGKKMVRCDCVRVLPTHEPNVVTLYSIYICVKRVCRSARSISCGGFVAVQIDATVGMPLMAYCRASPHWAHLSEEHARSRT